MQNISRHPTGLRPVSFRQELLPEKRLATTVSRNGFTLVELLVVILIIGILVAMLIPAIQQVRGAARRIQCANNLKQLALACHSYHSSSNRLPPGVNLSLIYDFETVSRLKELGFSYRPPHPTNVDSWLTLILPHIEQGALPEKLGTGISYSAFGDEHPPGTVIEIFLCPSDYIPEPTLSYVFPVQVLETGEVEESVFKFGVNSYFGNSGAINWPISQATFDGTLFANSKKTLSSISSRDGTSNTILCGERYSYDAEWDVLPEIRGWGRRFSARFMSLYTLSSGESPVNFSIPKGEGPSPPVDLQSQRLGAWGSGHVGGANFAMADGSVSFLTLTSASDLPALQALCIDGDGSVIFASDR